MSGGWQAASSRPSDLPAQVLVLAVTFVALATANAALYGLRRPARRLLASPAAQRGFGVLGGSLLCGAGGRGR